MNINNLKNLFPWLSDTDEPKVSNMEREKFISRMIPPSDVDSNDSSLCSLLFAPDPLTGLPQSDLGLMVKHDLSRDLLEYIDKRGIQFRHEIDGFDSVPLDLVKDRRAQFGTELREYVSKLRSSIEKKKSVDSSNS